MANYICHYCGKGYFKNKTESKFCSQSCMGKSKRKTILVNCGFCEKEFSTVPSKIATGKGKYCSRKCYEMGKRNRIRKLCKVCGAEFICAKSQGDQKYCSQKCHGEARVTAVLVNCKTCGEEFLARGSSMKYGRGKYCSKKCQGIGRRGEKSPTWNGGTAHFNYSYNFTEDFKLLVRERDNFVCSLCGANEGDIAHPVHHIDYNKKNTEIMNCILLCTSCHTKTNFNRKYWKDRLFSYLESKFYYNSEEYLVAMNLG